MRYLLAAALLMAAAVACVESEVITELEVTYEPPAATEFVGPVEAPSVAELVEPTIADTPAPEMTPALDVDAPEMTPEIDVDAPVETPVEESVEPAPTATPTTQFPIVYEPVCGPAQSRGVYIGGGTYTIDVRAKGLTQGGPPASGDFYLKGETSRNLSWSIFDTNPQATLTMTVDGIENLAGDYRIDSYVGDPSVCVHVTISRREDATAQ